MHRAGEKTKEGNGKGTAAHGSIPDTLQQLIEKQLLQGSEEEQRVLEVASVAGAEFAVAALAAALKPDLDTVEDVCEELAWQGHFLEEKGIAEWPDGTVSGRYGFRHALYQQVLYERIAEVRRVRLHRQIGERLEAAYGPRAAEVAAELAMHFEWGRDYRRAIQYLEQAGLDAVRRSAPQEAINLLSKGLELLKTLPDTPERAQQELTLQVAVGAPLITTKSWALAEQGHTEGVIAQMHQGLAVWRATGAEELRPYFLALLAEAYEKERQVEEGLRALAEALALVDKRGERWYEAELYRLKGELTLQQSKTSLRPVKTSPKSLIPSAQHLAPKLRRTPKPVSSRPSTSPAASKQSPLSCEQQRA